MTLLWTESSKAQSSCNTIFLSNKSTINYLLKKFSNLTGFQAEMKPLLTPAEGLAAKIALIERAIETIDLGYYIFKRDESGSAILYALKKAMDRGVKIRFLIDGAGSFDLTSPELVSLVAYSKRYSDNRLQVKVVNPIFSLQNFLLKINDFISTGKWTFDISSINNRMHDKIILVDIGTKNSWVIVGGRNLANADTGIKNLIPGFDYEVLIKGGAENIESDPLKVMSRHFENVFYHKLNLLLTSRIWGFLNVDTESNLLEINKKAKGIEEDKSFEKAAIETRSEDFWTTGFESTQLLFVTEAQNIIKTLRDRFKLVGWTYSRDKKASLSQSLFDGMFNAKKLITLISPYIFFTSQEIEQTKTWLLKNPNAVFKIYTNSLQSTNKFLVYALFRYITLPKLMELQNDPQIGSRIHIYLYKGNHLLHMKSAQIDYDTSFVTTSNFDPRSRIHNSEIGLWSDSPKNYSYINQKREAIEANSKQIQSLSEADDMITGETAPIKNYLMKILSQMIDITNLINLF